MGTLAEVADAIPTAMGVSAAIVPQLVPILRETRHEAMNIPTRIKLPGSIDRVMFTTLFTHPISCAMEEKAPARMNISNMSITPPLSSVLRGGVVFFFNSIGSCVVYKLGIENTEPYP
jgi:hypothetical protein